MSHQVVGAFQPLWCAYPASDSDASVAINVVVWLDDGRPRDAAAGVGAYGTRHCHVRTDVCWIFISRARDDRCDCICTNHKTSSFTVVVRKSTTMVTRKIKKSNTVNGFCCVVLYRSVAKLDFDLCLHKKYTSKKDRQLQRQNSGAKRALRANHKNIETEYVFIWVSEIFREAIPNCWTRAAESSISGGGQFDWGKTFKK